MNATTTRNAVWALLLLTGWLHFSRPSDAARAAEATAAAAESAKASAAHALLRVGFDNHQPGAYLPQAVRADWPGLSWESLLGRGEIVSDPSGCADNPVLRIAYPAGKIGSRESGGQFLVGLPLRADYYLTYRVYFATGFDFTKGGKLPGLTSGGASYTGGRSVADGLGWSARYMWLSGGRGIVYLYHFGQKGKYGDNLPLGVAFVPGRWYTLTQRIAVNTPGRNDGRLEVWVDQQPVLQLTDLVLRGPQASAGQGLIDSFYFSTFHGGNTPDYAPARDSLAYFDNFLISSTPPDGLPRFPPER